MVVPSRGFELTFFFRVACETALAGNSLMQYNLNMKFIAVDSSALLVPSVRTLVIRVEMPKAFVAVVVANLLFGPVGSRSIVLSVNWFMLGPIPAHMGRAEHCISFRRLRGQEARYDF